MSVSIERRRPTTSIPNADIQIELTRLIFDKLTATITLSSMSLIGATALLAHHYNDPVLWHIAIPTILLSVLRVAVVLSFQARKDQPLTIKNATQWELGYGLATCLYLCPLAISTIYCYRFHDSIARGLCMLGTFAICNGISARLGMRPWLADTSGLIALGALAIGVLQSKEPLVRFSILFILFYAYTYCESIRSKFDILATQLRTRRQMRELAEHDALTGLSNRRHFLSCVAAVCEQTSSFAIFYLDLDHFKRVNDTCGHQVGDALLQHVAERLRNIVQTPDILARIGGDEFAILHAHPATENSARALAGRINHAIAAPFAISGNAIKIGASVGIGLSGLGERDPDSLISRADHALYQVKIAGGGSFSFADSEERARTKSATPAEAMSTYSSR